MPKNDGTPTAAEKKAFEAAQEQFPSTDGHEGVEVAERSQDVTKPTSSDHEKVFVLLKRDFDTATATEEGADALHQANIEAARQAMIHQGLRPTADGRFVGSKDHGDGASVDLTYAIPAAAAAIATDAEVAHAYVTLDDQRAAYDGDAQAEPDPTEESAGQ